MTTMSEDVFTIIARKDADMAPDLVVDTAQVRITVYIGFASFMVLIWDHLITFADEVRYIWQGRKGILTILFLLNRYVTPLGFMVNLFAYLSPSWTNEHFVRFEGSMIVIGINITALMMLMRICALYRDHPPVIAFVVAVFCIELGVNAWLLSHGTRVVHRPQIHACSMVFDDHVPGGLASASAWLPLTYDTIVLVLTLNKTLGPVREKTAGTIAKALLRDGILYYSVIFSVTLVLTVMIAAAPPGLQNCTAQLELQLTVAMMSRITLHLRKQVHRREMSEDDLSIRLPTSIRSHVRFMPWPAGAEDFKSTQTGGQACTFMVHDSRGNSICSGSCSPRREMGNHSLKKEGAEEEWHELSPRASVV